MKPYLLSFCLILTTALWITINPEDVGAAGLAQDGGGTPTDTASILRDLAIVEGWIFEGDGDGDEMGFSVSGAGDVNNDGYTDIIVGAPSFTTTGPDGVYREGAAFVFYGSPNGLKASPDWIKGGGVQGVRFGAAVSAAGDVNADGFDDIIVGASDFKVAFDGIEGEPKSGAAFLFLGSETGLSQDASWEFYADAPDISIGFAVAAAGDVNNDGYDDFLVGAPNYESSMGMASGGKISLFLGSSTGPDLAPDWTYQCMMAESNCGYALAAAGDINNDNYDDIIIGAPHYDSPEANEGAVLVFFGSSQSPGDSPDWIMEGDQAEAWFGVAVAAAGDINKDGYTDILIGSSRYDRDEDHPDVGAAFVYMGSPDGPAMTPRWVAYGAEGYDGFGRAVSSAGDINQDSYADILIGAYKFGQNGAETQPDEGAAYIFYGSIAGPWLAPSWEVYGDKAETKFGYSLAAAGDVNGDGGDDVIIGAPEYKFDEKTVMGRAFVYLNTLNNQSFNNHVFIPFIVSK